MSKVTSIKNTLQEFSLPLIFGVIAGLIVANIDFHLYHHLVDYPVFTAEKATLFGQEFHLNLTLHFLINDIFMVLFFGIAAKEITESVLPGGALNPPSKAVNPLLGTLGGVVGPVIAFFIFSALFVYQGDSVITGIMDSMTPGKVIDPNSPEMIFRGWGIPTATDIALAWLVARLVFGKGHPAVGFLLLLAVADDAIGLGIIAIFYPDPENPVKPIWLILVFAGMLVSFILRKRGVNRWVPYIALGGTLSWLGLIEAHLHPALALVPIVPFLPGPDHDLGLYASSEDEGSDEHGHGHHHSPLEEFEHQLKAFVDFGLFFFAFANAGVEFSNINAVTWLILGALLVGKTVGIFAFSWLGAQIGFPLPTGMQSKHLFVSGVVAGLGLTVALFVAGEAYPGHAFEGPAKMGAVFSAVAGGMAFFFGGILKVHEKHDTPEAETSES
jgi:NhaA family Na+:H+ antiporter